MTRLLALLIGSSLLLSSLLFVCLYQPPTQTILADVILRAPIHDYQDSFTISQDQLHLDHEFVQYRIRIQENASINIQMNITHVMLDFQPVCYRMYLTNGTDFVTNETQISDTQVLAGILFDASILGHRIIIGGRQFMKHIPYGVMQTRNETVNATKGDIWYLTIIVLRKKLETVDFTALASTPCMEVEQTVRGRNLGFFSAWDGDFDGLYVGIKLLPLTPFGISFAYIKKKILTQTGALFEFISAFHRRGGISITVPHGTTITQTGRRLCLYSGFINVSGQWEFTAWGYGFPYKHLVTLFYADVDPHITNKAPASCVIKTLIYKKKFSYLIQG
jgi:hypothetical protein